MRRNRDYGALWLGQAVSSLGISISSFAYPVVVLAATGLPTRPGRSAPSSAEPRSSSADGLLLAALACVASLARTLRSSRAMASGAEA